MPLPQSMGRLNRAGPNRLIVHVAPWVPGFGVVHHRGRRSGRGYRTPVAVFRRGDEVVFAMVYGTRTDWVRNVRAAGGATVTVRGHDLRLSGPRLVHDSRRSRVPGPVRLALAAAGVEDFLVCDVEG
ncbi:nitroreductase family deazaflavin-dependent oxidoreductase [Mumia zhuanghuii]|uniref:Nitroreductase family deazaflavin-dependent oxidoreductase n=1 Tax=Mumia zhuanghuii TaxID=2585211 RepID=A0A5C4MP46_9ACTN|nr:nitroreductase family deazaflavin-dependent oxidoreductase [Mumia zhuanghuii]TNC46133.1 nitroreductase family deazaflavin-dependent oxidoreductase [Mumia zhuanghuii]TNC48842.1 nitroreductase family deazaflavin-dependent oxidoreductase [Mumia zhuanghuii]